MITEVLLSTKDEIDGLNQTPSIGVYFINENLVLWPGQSKPAMPKTNAVE
jgi:hypothetical protein